MSLSLVPLLVVETSPESLTTSPNNQFSIKYAARAEIDGQSIPLGIEWICNPISGVYRTTGYESYLTTSENNSSSTIYTCSAATGDTTVLISGI